MGIIRTLDLAGFRRAFNDCGREGQFSANALAWLYGWYDELSDSYELDVIGICCEWTEYDAPGEVWEAYGHLIGCDADPDRYDELLERIGDETSYALLDGSVLIQDF